MAAHTVIIDASPDTCRVFQRCMPSVARLSSDSISSLVQYTSARVGTNTDIDTTVVHKITLGQRQNPSLMTV